MDSVEYLRVCFDYKYVYREKDVEIKQGERLQLIQRTNDHWWKVLNPSSENPKPFFVPAQYVEVSEVGGKVHNNGEIKKTEETKQTSASTGAASTHIPFTPDSGLSPKARGKLASVKRHDSIKAKKEKVAAAAKLKNWSDSLEELANQIQFPGLKTSIIDIGGTPNNNNNNNNKPIPLPRTHTPGNTSSSSPPPPLNTSNTSNGKESSGNSTFEVEETGGGGGGGEDGSNNNYSNPNVIGPRSGGKTDSADSNSGTSCEDIIGVSSSPSDKTPSRSREIDSPSSKTPSSSMRSEKRVAPTPSPAQKPTKILNNNWSEYREDMGDARVFYYNNETGQSSWKPPRNSAGRSCIGDSIESLESSWIDLGDRENSNKGGGEVKSSIEEEEAVEEEEEKELQSSTHLIPEGWIETLDEKTSQICYVNEGTGIRWFTNQDSDGKVYYYEENSSKSSWQLPSSPTERSGRGINEGEGSGKSSDSLATDSSPTPKLTSPAPATTSPPSHSTPNHHGSLATATGPGIKKRAPGESNERLHKARSLLLPEELTRGFSISGKPGSLPRANESIWMGSSRDQVEIEKEGSLNRTKITENGKKLRKNWANVYCVLTKAHLSIFKDAKMWGIGKSEMEIELGDATLERTDDKSSRKNVFQINWKTRNVQVLLQSDEKDTADAWFNALNRLVKQPSDVSLSLSLKLKCTNLDSISDPLPGEKKKSSRLYRNKSTKVKITDSNEDMPHGSSKEMGAIRNQLKKFFQRRTSKDVLIKRGIYQDEPVFGCSIERLCKRENGAVPVPKFVQECITTIESKEENLKTDGLYRASGNLSQVQRIRLQVDQNNIGCLYQEEDVHVLAGALKLFFREMTEPLISSGLFEKSLQACNLSNKKEKIAQCRAIIGELNKANRATLQVLLKHLLKVSTYSEFNRMDIPNLAIVFGPTLMWPKESANMALDLMKQNFVIEVFLVEFESIFR